MILAFCKIHSFIGKYFSLTFLFLSYQTCNFRYADKSLSKGVGKLKKQQKCQELFSSNFCAPAFHGLPLTGSEIKFLDLAPSTTCDLTTCPWLERSPGWLLVIRVHICWWEGPRKIADNIPLTSNPFREKKDAPLCLLLCYRMFLNSS